MCGIFGYVGKRKDASKIVFEGIKSLEYRGYDSWGIASINQKSKIKNQKLVVEKHIGKIGNARLSVVDSPSSIALGHTRWATHGGVTRANAHPLLDCMGKIAIVHNGIVENYLDLKKSFSKKHIFKSETDTEVVVHLVEELAEKFPLDVAVRKAFLKVKGLNAFIFLGGDNRIIAVKNGSPLVVGVGRGENFISSDPSALMPHTKRAIYLEDGELISIGNNQIKLFDARSGKEKKIRESRIQWEDQSSKLGKYKHFMIKEIFEQPKVLKTIINNSKEVETIAKAILRAHGTFFIGCGTASYAALSGTYLFSSVAHKHVNFTIGSEFNYLEDYIDKRSLVIAVSQSGETIDVTQSVTRAKAKGAKIVAMTNVVGSTLWRLSDLQMPLLSGPEKAVCATKSFTSMVANLIFLAYCLGKKRKVGKQILAKTLKGVEKILSEKYIQNIKILARKLSREDDLYIIGRGLSYATALEATLKLKEVPYIHSEGFAGGELKHGVIALIEKGTFCIVFAPLDETYDDIVSNAAEIKARGGYIIGISPRENEVFDYHLPVADCGEGSVIVNTVPIQLLAYYVALEKGLDPDMPRNLAKSVTVK